MATRIQRQEQGRAQYLTCTINGEKVTAARYRLTSDRYSPWLVTEGIFTLPASAIARGRLLTRIFNEA